jgi:hypothetical protein
MSWQEPVSLPSEKTPSQIVKEIIAKSQSRTLNDVMRQYIDEQLELGNEEPGDWLEFK